MVYKCKICGGSLDISAEQTVCECEYCGNKQTLPKMNDEQKNNLLERAEHYRFIKDFDKATVAYDQVLSLDNTDADTYWSILLCRYGIEYVKDPASGNRKPTINRMQAASFLADADYKSVLKYADPAQKEIYEEQAKEIAAIQDEIRRIADKEEPYDIFISYKEKTDEGGRTKSSVLAQDLYDRLQKEGYRVFFSRISLEDKIGEKYEPYIYSALITSKVMLLVGTEKSEFTAPWVKNEWSRFLSMMKTDKDKRLIPCFRDMDVYDIPDELQFLQCQDMSKVGFEQDLLLGIKKILVKTDNEKSILNKRSDDPEEQMIHNAEVLFSLSNYLQAKVAFEEIVRLYPDNYKGWWGVLLCETNNFTTILYDRNHIKTLYSYVVKLADKDSLSAIEEKFCDYLALIARSDTANDFGKISGKVDAQNKIIKEIDDNLTAKERTLHEYESDIESYERTIKRVKESKKDVIICYACLGIGSILLFLPIALAFFISDEIGIPALVIGIIFLIIGGNWGKKVEARKNDQEMIKSRAYEINNKKEALYKLSEEVEKYRKKSTSENNRRSGYLKYQKMGKEKFAELLLCNLKKEMNVKNETNQEAEELKKLLISS